MKLNLKRSLFVSAAALGFFAAGVSGGQNASAKSYAKVTSNEALSMNSFDRNVNFTGSSALYTKAGTLKGAKKVASASILSSLANTNVSNNNVRAYRIAKTNRGSVYYKVVTFDGQYRGWIYGGKSTSDFGGGLTQYATTKYAAMTTDQQNGTFKITNPGTANDGKTVTYQQPAWTQYKVGRQITDSSSYANKTFKIDQAVTRSREGDQWVHISATDSANSAANGWILYSGLTAVSTSGTGSAGSSSTLSPVKIVLADPNGNQIKTINYGNGAKDQTLGTQNGSTWNLSSNDMTQLTSQINTALTGTGYSLSGTSTNGTLTTDQISALAQTKYGSTVTIKAVALGQSSLSLTANGLTAVDGPTINDSANPGYGKDSNLNYTASQLYKMQKDNTKDYQTLMNSMNPGWFQKTDNNVDGKDGINETYLKAAMSQYLTSSLPALHGISGDKITAGSIVSQANGVRSPLYPQFVKEGGFLGIGQQYVLRWYHITFIPVSAADDGVYGSSTPVSVNFSASIPASTKFDQ
ncbi:hypothetical protein [Lentilactobacillus farraginis]|uniref:Surface layer protein SlpB n=1 Tax=Lentilactobacillus farraginis DSM 18382 = JCM 14108 TaxID=1423743 RepID=X0PCF6_9LACO|nr:hypothetical protein [Lentilactobacillus farraginis]GAF38043.1 hypothetical protein JCM14108_3144 [Lentilactobacillus farraginis DSM 18382 = JCM 14108]